MKRIRLKIDDRVVLIKNYGELPRGLRGTVLHCHGHSRKYGKKWEIKLDTLVFDLFEWIIERNYLDIVKRNDMFKL